MATKPGRSGLSPLVTKKEKCTGVLAAPLRDGLRGRRRRRGKDDRGRKRKGDGGKQGERKKRGRVKELVVEMTEGTKGECD